MSRLDRLQAVVEERGEEFAAENAHIVHVDEVDAGCCLIYSLLSTCFKIIRIYDIICLYICHEVAPVIAGPFSVQRSLRLFLSLLFRFFLDVIGDVFQLLVDLAFDICGLLDCCIRRFLGSICCASACLVNLVH